MNVTRNESISIGNTTQSYSTGAWYFPSGFYLTWIGTPYVVNMSSQAWPYLASENMSDTQLSDLPMVRSEIIRFQNASHHENVTAQACSLYPCIRTYNLSISSNTPHEQLLETKRISAPSLQQGPFGPWQGVRMPCLINGSRYDASAFTSKNETNVIETYGLLPNNVTAWLPQECV